MQPPADRGQLEGTLFPLILRGVSLLVRSTEFEEPVSVPAGIAARSELAGEDRQALTRGSTDNAEAYQLYLKGLYYWNKRSAEGVQRAVEYFNRAVEADPTYALAYAGLADDCHELATLRAGNLAAVSLFPDNWYVYASSAVNCAVGLRICFSASIAAE